VNGTDAPYKDSTTGENVGTRHDRKLQVHRLLQNECRELEERGFAVVLAGDINIARSRLDGFPRLRESPVQHCKNRADFEAKFFGEVKVEGKVLESSVSANSKPSETVSKEMKPETSWGMIDSFRHLHAQQKGYTYYPRSQGPATFGASCDRVDMILISQTLRDNLVSAGIHETVADRGPSDHVPLYASLQFPQSLTGDASEQDPAT
jgi:exonuclease III